MAKFPIISGIQQLGIGVPHVHDAFKWYRQNYELDIPMFEEAATAALMLPYTGGEPRDRHAILALNIAGGGGLEIWQYTSRVPQPSEFEIQLGDLGIFSGKIKSNDLEAAHEVFEKKGNVHTKKNDKRGFFTKDKYGNYYQIVPGLSWFKKPKGTTGGVAGCLMGVTDMDTSVEFYSHILGYDTVVFDEEDVFEDYAGLPGGKGKFRRVILRHSKDRKGSFSELLGASEIELVQALDRSPRKIFENRFWGDLGFIHLCFDIKGMSAMKAKCEAAGHPFTVDSADSFDMGEAAGHFSYIEDPDGTLIEFVETHKIPILKKIGWYMDLRKKNPEKSIPSWILSALAFGRVKD